MIAFAPLLAIHPLATLNAVLNALATLLLAAGWLFIARGHWRAHRAAMVAAFLVSACFLVSYLTYHYLVGHVSFAGQGTVRLVYLGILLTHIVLAVAVPFSIAAAVYVNQLASSREQSLVKPAIEFIGAIPSVVLGFFGILVFGEALRNLSQLEWLQWFPGFPMAERLTILNAGLLLAYSI